MFGGKLFVLNFDEVVSEGIGGCLLDDFCFIIFVWVVLVEFVYMSIGRVRFLL